MGSNGGGGVMPYVMNGLKAVMGGASQFVAPGNPIGLSMIGSGVGGIAGQAGGGNRGAAMGSDIGGFAAPGMMGTPNMSTIGSALSANPSLNGISPNMVSGVSPSMPSGTQNFLQMIGGSNLGDFMGAMGEGAAAVRPSPQPQMSPSAPGFRGGSFGPAGFAQMTRPMSGSMAPAMSNQITPPSPQVIQLLRTLGLPV